jgi:glycosyltransferase involved in cell wall biosynthesis
MKLAVPLAHVQRLAGPVPISVALDATLWDEPTTGISLYGRAVAGALTERGISVLRVGARRSGEFPRRLRSRTLYTLAELPRVLPRTRADIFHAIANVDLPLVRVPGVAYVLTVHDLIPLTSPETVSRAFHWQFCLWLQRSLALADHVVCVSQFTRTRLLAFHPKLDPARVSFVHNGVDHVRPVPLDPVSEAWLRSLGLPERWVLYAGALDARKNVGLLLDALEELGPATAPALVLAGQRWFGAGPVERQIGALRARGFDIRPLGYLTEPVLWAVMARAPLFVFPSRDEGFGLPPLEAMSLGTPVIISDASALPEVCGPAAVQVPVGDATALAMQIANLLDDPRQRAQLSEAGRTHARPFTWNRVAEHLDGIYRTLTGQNGRGATRA